MGVPQIMMGFTADNQVNPALVTDRDQRFRVDSARNKAHRADIDAPEILPGADAWKMGNTVQIADPTGAKHAHPGK